MINALGMPGRIDHRSFHKGREGFLLDKLDGTADPVAKAGVSVYFQRYKIAPKPFARLVGNKEDRPEHEREKQLVNCVGVLGKLAGENQNSEKRQHKRNHKDDGPDQVSSENPTARAGNAPIQMWRARFQFHTVPVDQDVKKRNPSIMKVYAGNFNTGLNLNRVFTRKSMLCARTRCDFKLLRDCFFWRTYTQDFRSDKNR
jgi:hypothetical protein